MSTLVRLICSWAGESSTVRYEVSVLFHDTCALLAHEVRRFTHLSWAGLFAGAFVISAANTALPQVSLPAADAPAPIAAPSGVIPVAAPSPLVALAEPPPPPITFGQPLPGRAINSPFGLRRLPWENHGRLHEGVDIAAPLGAAIQAAADGVVTRAGYSPSYGNFVEIRHAEGLTSFYAHMRAVARGVRSGQAVRQGQMVGKVGNTGELAGAHLHFEMHDRKGHPLNPARFIGQQFADAGALPISAAARISPRVRLASVGRWPARVLARATHAKGELSAGVSGGLASVERVNGRIRAQIRANTAADDAAIDAAAATPTPYKIIAKDAAA